MRLRYRVTESFTIPPKDDTVSAKYFVFAKDMKEAASAASQSFVESVDKVVIELAEPGDDTL